MKTSIILPVIILAFVAKPVLGQITTDQLSGKINTVTTAVPFLTIPMGPSMNSDITTVPNGTLEPAIFGNIGLLGFENKKFGFSVSYTPWLRKLIPDINLVGLGGFWRINNRSSLGLGIRYFSLGNIEFRDDQGTLTTQFNPNEFSTSLSYVINFDEFTSLGMGLEFVYSNLTGGYSVGGVGESHPGTAFAANLGFLKKFMMKDDRFSHMIGVSLNHVGSKISYTKSSDMDFIPITLAVGYQFRFDLDNISFALSYEALKLLVPSPPMYYADSVDTNNDPVISAGYDPNVSVPLGMIRSFYDAPGGFSEEMNEITHQVGFNVQAYGVNFGTGLFYEAATKGNRKFFTVGLGYNILNRFKINFSYLIPVNNQNSPLANTMRFGVNVLF